MLTFTREFDNSNSLGTILQIIIWLLLFTVQYLDVKSGNFLWQTWNFTNKVCLFNTLNPLAKRYSCRTISFCYKKGFIAKNNCGASCNASKLNQGCNNPDFQVHVNITNAILALSQRSISTAWQLMQGETRLPVNNPIDHTIMKIKENGNKAFLECLLFCRMLISLISTLLSQNHFHG